jgi:hypothetical protein
MLSQAVPQIGAGLRQPDGNKVVALIRVVNHPEFGTLGSTFFQELLCHHREL